MASRIRNCTNGWIALGRIRPSNWLIFGYDVPDEPSRVKVRLWRQLKSLGALYPQMSFCILPDSRQTRADLERLAAATKQYGPNVILQAKAAGKQNFSSLLSLFRDELRSEYLELAEECNEFLDEIKSNIASGNITPEEVSELEAALDGLKRWHEKIQRKDFVGTDDGSGIDRLFNKCSKALLRFSARAERHKVKP